MKLRLNRAVHIVGAAVAVSAVALAVPTGVATAAPPSYTVSSVPGGIRTGSELALDQTSHNLYITDADSVIGTRGGTSFQVNPHPTDPKVTVFDTNTLRPTRSIKFGTLPTGVIYGGPIPLAPIEQVPDGIALDNTRGRLIVTNSHANGIVIAPKNARTVTPANLISIPGAHPMGIAVIPGTGRAYVSLNYINQLAIVDTDSRRIVSKVPTFAPTFLDIDIARHRLYIGNADTNKRTNYLAVLDTRTNKVIKRIPTPSNVRPKVDPATGLIYGGSFDTGKVLVIDPKTLRVIKTIETNGTPNKLAIDNQRRLLYLSNLQKRTLTVIDLRINKVVATVPVGAPIHSIQVDQRTGTIYGTQHQSSRLSVIRIR